MNLFKMLKKVKVKKAQYIYNIVTNNSNKLKYKK